MPSAALIDPVNTPDRAAYEHDAVESGTVQHAFRS